MLFNISLILLLLANLAATIYVLLYTRKCSLVLLDAIKLSALGNLVRSALASAEQGQTQDRTKMN